MRAGLLATVMMSAMSVSAFAADPPSIMSAPASDVPSVYAPPEPPGENEGANNGGVNVDLTVKYLTDDVYRGVSHDRAIGGDTHASNFQADTKFTFNFGNFPHPYFGVFTNVADSDPVSRFQEIRPYIGVNYTLRPLIFDVSHISYIYPERERLDPSPNSSEVIFKLTLDDSYYFLTPRPVLSPYVSGAYDYDRNKGWYLEAGLKHDFVFEDISCTLTTYGDVAYISNFAQQFILTSPQDSGFQHWDLGLIGDLSVTDLLKIPPRYGNLSVQGYFTYTGRFDNDVLANSVLWGGVGIHFKY